MAEAAQQLQCAEVIGSSAFIVPANVMQHIVLAVALQVRYRYAFVKKLFMCIIFLVYFSVISVEVTSKYS